LRLYAIKSVVDYIHHIEQQTLYIFILGIGSFPFEIMPIKSIVDTFLRLKQVFRVDSSKSHRKEGSKEALEACYGKLWSSYVIQNYKIIIFSKLRNRIY
jgi:hypothetical protein